MKGTLQLLALEGLLEAERGPSPWRERPERRVINWAAENLLRERSVDVTVSTHTARCSAVLYWCVKFVGRVRAVCLQLIINRVWGLECSCEEPHAVLRFWGVRDLGQRAWHPGDIGRAESEQVVMSSSIGSLSRRNPAGCIVVPGRPRLPVYDDDPWSYGSLSPA